MQRAFGFIHNMKAAGKTGMIAWEPNTTNKASLGKKASAPADGMLYGLAVAFPSWAGAILVLYALVVSKFGFSRIRVR